MIKGKTVKEWVGKEDRKEGNEEENRHLNK
jgi:hypothetical protein